MPQKRGGLNALAAAYRKVARGLRRRPRPGTRLDPERFVAHAAALAAQLPKPRGLWLSFLFDGAADPAGIARLRESCSKSGLAEVVACDARLADPETRWREALGRARAPFVGRLDLSGRLAPFAIERIAASLAERPDALALYTDEALTDAREIALKPAFDPVLLDSFDYFGRVVVYARQRLLAVGGWREDGPAGDYDLALRIVEDAPPGSVLHLPYPAFIGPARACDAKAAAVTVATRYRERGRDIVFAPGLAPDRLRPSLVPGRQAWPKVSVVIPSRDAPALIGRTLAGLFEGTDYPDFDVSVVDNGSTDPATLALYARYGGPRFCAEVTPAPFNFSRAVNRGAALSRGPLILLLNNDVEVLQPGWLKEMVGGFDYPDVGVVGAKLLYPDRTLQHVGVIAGLGGYAGHWHIGRPAINFGPQRRLAARQSLSVVTGACMLVSRGCFERLGGFDEDMFPIAYNDVDFCLRAGAMGYRVLWTPFAELIHHESASRGSDETAANRARFARDKAALRSRHRTDLLEDRAYNPWAARGASDPWPTARETLPDARS